MNFTLPTSRARGRPSGSVVARLVPVFFVAVVFVSPGRAAESVVIMSDEYGQYTSSRENGSGVILDVVREAFAEAGIEVEYKFAPWIRCEKMVAEGEAFAAAPYFKTEERLARYNFSDPIIYSHNEFFYNRAQFPGGFTWSTLADFRGYIIGAVRGYWYIPRFERVGIAVEKVSSDRLNLAKLLTDRIDFTVIDRLVGEELIETHFPEEASAFATTKKPLSFIKFHLLVSRSYPDTATLT